jgi:ribosome-associated heat shock protein Hsp15
MFFAGEKNFKLNQISDKIRIDKWLWSVRVFKTRTLAGEACNKGRIFVNGMPAKASKDIRIGDIVIARKPPVIYSYLVKGLPGSRLAAKLVSDYLEDQTSIEEINKLKINDTLFFKRDRGTGRPTKKERRQMDDLTTDL